MERRRWKEGVFLLALGTYTLVYYVLFAGRLGQYLENIRWHFEFARRWF